MLGLFSFLHTTQQRHDAKSHIECENFFDVGSIATTDPHGIEPALSACGAATKYVDRGPQV
jgi:hypothetical protein